MQMNDLDAKYGVSQQAASAVQVSVLQTRCSVVRMTSQHSMLTQ